MNGTLRIRKIDTETSRVRIYVDGAVEAELETYSVNAREEGLALAARLGIEVADINLVPAPELPEGVTPYSTTDLHVDGELVYPYSITDQDGVVLGVRTFIGKDGEPGVQIIVDDPIDLRAIVNLTPEQWDAIRSVWPEQEV